MDDAVGVHVAQALGNFHSAAQNAVQRRLTVSAEVRPPRHGHPQRACTEALPTSAAFFLGASMRSPNSDGLSPPRQTSWQPPPPCRGQGLAEKRRRPPASQNSMTKMQQKVTMLADRAAPRSCPLFPSPSFLLPPNAPSAPLLCFLTTTSQTSQSSVHSLPGEASGQHPALGYGHAAFMLHSHNTSCSQAQLQAADGFICGRAGEVLSGVHHSVLSVAVRRKLEVLEGCRRAPGQARGEERKSPLGGG